MLRSLPLRLLAPGHRRSLSVSSRALRALPGAAELLRSLERAPCLRCGEASVAPTHRVACRVSGLPLACSERCAEELERDDRALLERFATVVDDLEFAASADARVLFSQVLAPSRRLTNAHHSVDSWTDYLDLYSPAVTANQPSLIADERAVRLASSAFSFVLTLAAFLPRLLLDSNASNMRDRQIALHVIGARAEAMMPDYLWDEVALLHPELADIEITLVGDHVPRSRGTMSSRGLPLRVEAVRGLYHDVELPLTRDPDAFVLFNPGVGHPLLRERWRPTIKKLLESGKPILMTSFSAADQERDVVELHQLAASIGQSRPIEFLVQPQENPFRSLKYQVNDDGGCLALIQTNSHIMAAQLSSR